MHDPELGGGEPDAERIGHHAGHPGNLALQGGVESVDRGRTSPQRGIAEGPQLLLDFLERQHSLVGEPGEILRVPRLDERVHALAYVGHRARVDVMELSQAIDRPLARRQQPAGRLLLGTLERLPETEVPPKALPE